MVEFADVSFARVGCGCGAADDYARAGRAECDWAGTGRTSWRDTDGGIAGGGERVWSAAIFYAGAGYGIREDARTGEENLGRAGARGYGARDPHVSPGSGDQRMGRGAQRTWSPSGERDFDAAGCGCGWRSEN